MTAETHRLDPWKSEHQLRVDEFQRGIGNEVPGRPQVPSREKILLYIRLLFEEVFETAVAAGIDITLNGDPLMYEELHFFDTQVSDLVEMADGLGDVRVISTGLMSLCGIPDEPLMKAIDDNNLEKVNKGTKCPQTGKLLKPKDHKPPDIAKVLRDQGWEG